MNRNLSPSQTVGMYARRGEVKGAQYLREGLAKVSGQAVQQRVSPGHNDNANSAYNQPRV